MNRRRNPIVAHGGDVRAAALSSFARRMASHIRQIATSCAIGVRLAGWSSRPPGGLQQMKQAADPASKQCIGAMERTLAEDPHYAAPPNPPVPADRLDEAIARFNELTGERLACAQTIVRMH